MYLALRTNVESLFAHILLVNTQPHGTWEAIRILAKTYLKKVLGRGRRREWILGEKTLVVSAQHTGFWSYSFPFFLKLRLGSIF